MRLNCCRVSVRKSSGLIAAITLLVGTTMVSQLTAWSTEDPTRAVAYQGKTGADDGVIGTGPENVVVDSAGNIYTVVLTGGELNVGPGSNSATVGDLSRYALVLTKTNSSGDLVWYREWTGTDFSFRSLVVNDRGVFIAGSFSASYDLDPTTGNDTYTPVGSDTVIVQLTSEGSYVGHLAIPTVAGREIRVSSMVSTSDNNVVIAGKLTGDTTFPGRSVFSAANEQGFVAKLNTTSGQTDWLVDISGAGLEVANNLVVSSDDSLFFLVVSTSTSVTVTGASGPPASLTSTATNNGIVARVTSTGAVAFAEMREEPVLGIVKSSSSSVMVQYGGGDLRNFDSAGTSNIVGNFVRQFDKGVLGADGKMRLIGYINGPIDFDIGLGVDTRTPTASHEGFLLTITSDFRTESVQRFTGPSDTYVESVTTAPDGGFVLSGYSTAGTINISNTTHSGSISTSTGMTHMFFLVRYDAAGTTGTTTTSTTTSLAPVGAPTSARYVTGNKRVTVKWSDVSGASSYVVATTGGTEKCTSTSTSCVVSGLKNGKMYTYVVRAINAAGLPSVDARSVRVIPGFTLRTTTHKVKKSPLLTSIVSSPSKGFKRWTVTSGSCRISGVRLVMPAKSGSCRLRLAVAKKGSYPAMSTTVKVTVTR